ncbi:MAG: hypothetical protein JO112_07940, partial [Planctomycetes bacterium]|nr:hypothetical protein [Planctomycetota bacterium]
MDLLLQFLIHHSFGLLLLAAALVLGLVLLLRLRRGRWSLALLLLSTSCTLMGLGGLAGPGWVALHFPGNWSLWAGWLVGSALAALFVMLVVVVLTGHWSARLGFTMGGLLLFGLGGLCEQAVSQGLAEGVRTLARLEVVQPWWLLLLGLIPVII